MNRATFPPNPARELMDNARVTTALMSSSASECPMIDQLRPSKIALEAIEQIFSIFLREIIVLLRQYDPRPIAECDILSNRPM